MALDIPAKIIARSVATVVMQESDNGFLECPFIGSLSPVIIYYHDERPINTSNGHYKVFTNGTLMIVNVVLSDKGSYYCRIASKNNIITNGTERSTPVKVVIFRKYS